MEIKPENFTIKNKSLRLSKVHRIALAALFFSVFFLLYDVIDPNFAELCLFGGLIIFLVITPLILYGSNFKQMTFSTNQIDIDGTIFQYPELNHLHYHLSPNGRNISVNISFLKKGKRYDYSYSTILADSEKMRILINQLTDVNTYWENNFPKSDFTDPELNSKAHLMLSFLSIFYVVIFILIFYFSNKNSSYDYDKNFNKYYPVPLAMWLLTFMLHILIYPILRKAPNKFSLISRTLRYKRYVVGSFFLGVLIYILSIQLLFYFNQYHGKQTAFKKLQCEVIKSERDSKLQCAININLKCNDLGIELKDTVSCTLEPNFKVGSTVHVSLNKGSLGGYYWPRIGDDAGSDQ